MKKHITRSRLIAFALAAALMIPQAAFAEETQENTGKITSAENFEEDEENNIYEKKEKIHEEGCVLEQDHEGECKFEEQREHEEGCILEPDHAGECETEKAEGQREHEEGCILESDHEGECETENKLSMRSMPEEGRNVYVSSSGNDDTAKEDSVENPYKTLSKAVEVAQDGDTIIVMDDITAEGTVARITDKHITITSQNQDRPVTITRGDKISGADSYQKHYNSAIIEVTTNGGDDSENASSVTLKNIILTDDGKHSGTYFAQTNTEIDGNMDGNLAFVQDGMITAHGLDNRSVYIILDEGAVLKDFGGMSAVYATLNANIIMKDGSVIKDEKVEERKKSDNSPEGETGPAGAVWLQGSRFIMENGASIENVIGRAVYADGGNAEIDGEISNITDSKDIWQGKTGSAIHIRGDAEVTLGEKFLMDNKKIEESLSSAVYNCGGKLDMKYGAVMRNLKGTVISGVGSGSVEIIMDGEIYGIEGGHIIDLNNDAANLYCKIGENGYIHDNNVWYGSIYMQGKGIHLDHYGRIEDNYSTDKSGGIALANNYAGHTAVMYEGATISNNISKNAGAGVMVSCGTFIMEGGEISGNKSIGKVEEGLGGGVYVRRGGTFVMNGGTIKDNYAKGSGGGIYYIAGDYNELSPNVILNAGRIFDNYMNTTFTEDGEISSNGISNDIAVADSDFSHIKRFMSISDDVVLGNSDIYLEKYPEATLTDPSGDVKFGNASDRIITELKSASESKGWSADELVSLWYQSSQQTIELEFKNVSYNTELPVYAAVVSASEDGGILADGPAVEFYAVNTKGGSLRVNVPAGNENGYGMAIVQPTQNYGEMIISAPEKIDIEKNNVIEYTSVYEMSENLKNLILGEGLNNVYITVSVDPSLSVDENNVIFISDIFEASVVDYNNSGTITITCLLKNNWQSASDLRTTLKFTGTLDTNIHAEGAVLTASGKFTANVGSTEVFVPANIVNTKLEKVERYIITSEAGKNGSISPKGEITVSAGESQEFKITADKGYVIDRLSVDGETIYEAESEKSYTYTFENIDSNHTISVKFEKKDSGSSGGISLPESNSYYVVYHNGDDRFKDGRYSEGEKVTVKDDVFPSSEGMSLVGWSTEEGGDIEYEAGDTFRMPDRTVDLYAVWKDKETEIHKAYINGYPDGTVMPDRMITRAEAAVMFYNLMTYKPSDKKYFSDVADEQWYTDAVTTLAGSGVINGYPDSTFRPDKPITRAEFVAMAINFANENGGAFCGFSDVTADMWYYDAVAGATQNGWISGYPDGTFKPERFITRAEASSVINRMNNREMDAEFINEHIYEVKTFSDLNEEHWAYDCMMEAANGHEFVRENLSDKEKWTEVLD